MNFAARIRDWLAVQDGPRSVPEIAAGIGAPPADRQTAHTVHRMARDGILVREGRCRSYRFSPGRDLIVRDPMPKDERLRRAREAQRKRRSREGGVSLDEYRAQQAAQHQAWLARKAAEKAQRKADRDAARAKRQAEQKAARAAARATRATAPRKPRAPSVAPPSDAQRRKREVFDRAFVPKPPPQPARVESVDEFLRRGGRIERLQPGVCSLRDEWMEAA